MFKVAFVACITCLLEDAVLKEVPGSNQQRKEASGRRLWCWVHGFERCRVQASCGGRGLAGWGCWRCSPWDMPLALVLLLGLPSQGSAAANVLPSWRLAAEPRARAGLGCLLLGPRPELADGCVLPRPTWRPHVRVCGLISSQGRRPNWSRVYPNNLMVP